MATTQLHLASPEATDRLAERIAPHLAPGDFIGLTGGLGTGKSRFARALIAARLRAVGRAEEVPSPSFTLVQTYELGDDAELWHADLYRLGDMSELAEIGLDEAMAGAICVVEWAERLDDALPARALSITLAFDPSDDDARRATLTATGAGWHWLGAALAAIEPAVP